MDRGKSRGKFLGMTNHKIYLDLKDIIRENALCYLPAKTLMRFKSVCRDWKLYISSPFFAHNQSQCCRAIGGLFWQDSGETPMLVPFDAMSCGVPDPLLSFLPEPVEIRSSSNGLLCCQSSSREKAYYICNPVTKQWKKLPKPNADHGSISAVALVFEPSLLNFVAEFKVVCAFRSNDFDDGIEFEVYNSVEHSWKIAGEILFKPLSPIRSAAVCVKNVIYWTLSTGHILSYDLVNDRSRYSHAYNYNTPGCKRLGDVNGKPCSVSSSGSSIYLSVLENEHRNTMPMEAIRWNKRETRKLIANVAHQNIVFFSEDVLVLQGNSELYLYSLKDNTSKELISLGRRNVSSIVPYVNSLVSV